MTLEKLTLKLDRNNDGTVDLEYEIYPIQSVDVSSTKEAFSIAPPGLSARENILLGITGMQADISIDCRLWNDGSDRANGTYTSTVTTVEEQARYLEDEIQAADFAAAWQLDHTTGAAFNNDDVFLEAVEPTVLSVDSPKWKPCTLRLRRGQSIG